MMKKKKTKRQQLAEKEAAARKLVDKANALVNPIESLTSFHKYVIDDDKTIDIRCMRAKDSAPECLTWILDIMERNMKSMYEQCEWGWDPVAKEKELTEPGAWYLVASSDNKFLGFSHFRFDVDYGVEVLYCYEIQLELEIRRKGLGQFMMSLLEAMAVQNKMKKVVLTVFKHNPSALQFFHSLGYRLDKTSPPASDRLHYVIVSKAVDDGSVSKKTN